MDRFTLKKESECLCKRTFTPRVTKAIKSPGHSFSMGKNDKSVKCDERQILADQRD